jgi:hypothetical protein
MESQGFFGCDYPTMILRTDTARRSPGGCSGSGVTDAETTTLTGNGCDDFFDFCGEWGYTNVRREGFVWSWDMRVRQAIHGLCGGSVGEKL